MSNDDDDSDEILVVDPSEMDLRAFPEKVYEMVVAESQANDDTVRWMYNGEAFDVTCNDKLSVILGEYFGYSDIESFERQLTHHGWGRDSMGKYNGAYYHQEFHRDRPNDIKNIKRIRQREPNQTPSSSQFALQAAELVKTRRLKRSHEMTDSSDSSNNDNSIPSKSISAEGEEIQQDASASSRIREVIEIDDGSDSSDCEILFTCMAPPKASSPQRAAAYRATSEDAPADPTASRRASTETSTQEDREVSESILNDDRKPLAKDHITINNQKRRNYVEIQDDANLPARSDVHRDTVDLQRSLTGQRSRTPVSLSPAHTSVTSETESGKEDNDEIKEPPKNAAQAESDNVEKRTPTKNRVWKQYSRKSPGELAAADSDDSTTHHSEPRQLFLNSLRLCYDLNDSLQERTTEGADQRGGKEPTGENDCAMQSEDSNIASLHFSNHPQQNGSRKGTEKKSNKLPLPTTKVSAQERNNNHHFAEGRSSPFSDADQVEIRSLSNFAKRILKELRHRRQEEREEYMSKSLHKNRTLILQEKRKQSAKNTGNEKSFFKRRLPTTAPHRLHTITRKMKSTHVVNNKQADVTEVPLTLLEGADQRLPRHNAPIMIDSLCGTVIDDVLGGGNNNHEDSAGNDDEDRRIQLDFVPYLSDNLDINPQQFLSKYFKTDNIEQRSERGAQYEEDERNIEIDHVLNRLCAKLGVSCSDRVQLQASRAEIVAACSKAMDTDVEWVQERYDEKVPDSLTEAENDGSMVVDSDVTSEDQAYLSSIDSIRGLFCSRCLTFDCELHGLVDSPSLTLQYELGIRRKRDNYWGEADASLGIISETDVRHSQAAERHPRQSQTVNSSLTELQKVLCRRWFYFFEGDAVKIADALRVHRGVVEGFILSESLQLPELSLGLQCDRVRKPPKNGNDSSYYNMANYNAKWLRNLEEKDENSLCLPCTHSDPCTDETCSCVKSVSFCTQACGRAEYSANFFRGCSCKNFCDRKYCQCFAAGRECDPDLCKSCGTCSDGFGQLSSSHRCRNDNLTMRRHRRLFVGRSGIPEAGWGLFTRDKLKKGDYIDEYLGELISDNEGDGRGALYDQKNLNYLFDQGTGYAVDAFAKGNKTRFANHSENANVDTKYMIVKGDVRVAFVANKYIAAQSEVSLPDPVHAYAFNWELLTIWNDSSTF